MHVCMYYVCMYVICHLIFFFCPETNFTTVIVKKKKVTALNISTMSGELLILVQLYWFITFTSVTFCMSKCLRTK